MAHRFKEGDVVKVVRTAKNKKEYMGMVLTIREDIGYLSDVAPRDMCYRVDEFNTHFLMVEDSAIEKVYDGEEKSSWEKCEWNPNNIKVRGME